LLDYYECKETCAENSSCKLDCGTDLTNCLNSCPCQVDCPTGCDQCESDFCQGVQCRDPEANEDYIACENYHEQIYHDCVYTCPPADFSCVGSCARDFEQGIEGCPCQSGCPLGCPCENYCSDSTTASTTSTTVQSTTTVADLSAVLILSTFKAANVPVLIDAAASEDNDFNFEIDEWSEVDRSCSLTWQNELYVFGGRSRKTQISKVKSCRLEPVGQLAFEHDYGSCVSVAADKVVLCFNYQSGDYKKCRMASSPTGAFSEMSLSIYSHKATRIATDDEFIIAVGSYNDNHKTELLNVDGNNWSIASDYPFASKFISQAPIIHVGNSFFLFGGWSGASSAEKTIGRFDIKTRSWYNAGSLVDGRRGHNAIYDGQYVLVVGGSGSKITEKCSIANDQMTCASQLPKLTEYAYYPELFLVKEGYCKQLY